MAHINPLDVFEGNLLSDYQVCDIPSDFELDIFLEYKAIKDHLQDITSATDRNEFLQN
jgi:hypothetical protein